MADTKTAPAGAPTPAPATTPAAAVPDPRDLAIAGAEARARAAEPAEARLLDPDLRGSRRRGCDGGRAQRECECCEDDGEDAGE